MSAFPPLCTHPLCSDYRDMGVLDQYDAAILDNREFSSLDPETRAAAEAAMMDRDRKEGRTRKSRIAAALESDDGACRLNGRGVCCDLVSASSCVCVCVCVYL